MKNLMFFLVLTGLQLHSSFAQSNLLEHHIRLVSYCPGDEYAILQAVNDPKPNFKYLWSFNGSTEAQVQLPKSLFGQEICLTRTCPCGKVTKHCFTFNPPTESPSIAGEAKNATCYGLNNGSIAVNGSAANLTYHWSNGKSGDELTSLSPGSYSVYATTPMGCKSNTLFFSLSEPAPLPSVSIQTTPTTCPESSDGAARILDLPPGTTVGWPTGNKVATDAVSGLKKGSYQIQLSDASGRCGFQSFTIDAPDEPELSTTLHKAVSCYGYSDAELALSLSGGQPPYTIQWDTDQLPATPGQTIWRTGLAAGNYPLTVIDQKGCTGQHTIKIDQPDLVAAHIQAPSHNGATIPCANQPTAEIIVNATGGNGEFQYAWLDKAGNFRFNSSVATLEPGTYMAVVTDQKGCTASATYTITRPEKIVIKTKKVKKGRLFAATKIDVKGGTGKPKLSHKTLTLFLKNKKKTKVTAVDANNCEASRNIVVKLDHQSPKGRGKAPGQDPKRFSNCPFSWDVK